MWILLYLTFLHILFTVATIYAATKTDRQFVKVFLFALLPVVGPFVLTILYYKDIYEE